MNASRLAELHALSASPDELVLPKELALEAVSLLAATGHALLGWEGWLRDGAGRVGHSSEHQGFTAPGDMPHALAADVMKRTIAAAAADFAARPERRDAALLFCITYDVPPARR